MSLYLWTPPAITLSFLPWYRENSAPMNRDDLKFISPKWPRKSSTTRHDSFFFHAWTFNGSLKWHTYIEITWFISGKFPAWDFLMPVSPGARWCDAGNSTSKSSEMTSRHSSSHTGRIVIYMLLDFDHSLSLSKSMSVCIIQTQSYPEYLECFYQSTSKSPAFVPRNIWNLRNVYPVFISSTYIGNNRLVPCRV